MDLDILLYGDMVMSEPDLVIPHPRMTHRRFVLAPLVAIAPGARHPVLGITVEELLRRLGSETSDPLVGASR
jgi:2-amino-4-hydroxy-6-hydroxymethyldihydropteridine diphosphokinase